MAQYQYANERGEVREISQRMTDEHPAAIVFEEHDNWRACDPTTPSAYVRVFGQCQLTTDPIHSRYPHVSYSLPKELSRKLAPTRTKDGLVVVESAAQDANIQAATGWTKDN